MCSVRYLITGKIPAGAVSAEIVHEVDRFLTLARVVDVPLPSSPWKVLIERSRLTPPQSNYRVLGGHAGRPVGA
jgi:hypothetical protein